MSFYCETVVLQMFVLSVLLVLGASVVLILPVLAGYVPSLLLVRSVLALIRPPVQQHSRYSEHELYLRLQVYSEYEAYWETL